MSLVNAFGEIALDASVQETNDILTNGAAVNPENVNTELREAFEVFDTTSVWSATTGSGDIVQIDGNSASSSYLVISKDPLTAGTETSIVTRNSFKSTFETAVGLSMSQRVIGQECSIEAISADPPMTPVADIALASIQQTTTTLTVITAAPHGLVSGTRIGVYGVTSDSRLNYPSLVIASVLSATSFTCTATPNGALPSVTAGAFTNQGYVYMRPSMGYAKDGMSQIFENSTATNASMYVRSYSGDALPSGTASGNHSVTVGTTAPTQLINAPYTYAFSPANEYKFQLQSDRAQYFDYGVDGVAQTTTRLNRSSVVPSADKDYNLRFRVSNNKGLTVPSAKIVTASKSGTTTATISTDAAHGLTVGDYVVIYGIRDTANFLPLATPTVVASVLSSTQFTLVYGGTTATVTSYGGFVARVNGGVVPAGFAATGTNSAVQSVSVASGSNELTVVTTAAATLSVGDYVNMHGLRDTASGADVGVDGVYRCASISGTTSVFQPIDSTTLPSSLASTNCGGAIIKRTDVRISYARVYGYLRERIEVLNRSDAFNAIPVVANGGTIATVSSVTGVTTVTTVSTVTACTTVGTASLAINTIVADQASAALTTTTTGATITPTSGALAYEVSYIVTAVTGTNPTLDVVLQESDDTGTSWYDVYHFPRITATGQYRTPLIPLTGNRLRWVQTVTGTTPSFTRSINHLQSHSSVPLQRQFIDRAMAPNTANSTTPSWFLEGCVDATVFVSMGAVTTTAPVLAFEISPDNTNWVQVGADITTAANTNNLLQVANVQGRFCRVRVKTVGSGATLGFVMVKGIGY